jgi:cytosine/adenosine deaminase-related metal-dependent hydrolase
MRRVLDRNGRLALSVWNNVGIYSTAEADFSDVEVSVSRINVHLPQIALSNGALGAMSANLGSLAPGKYADLLVLDRDYLTVPSDEIKDIKPVLTMVGGKIVYGSAN